MHSAIILAAGRGSRLGRLTATQPKCLTRLAGRSLIDWQLAALRAVGIDDITLVLGYHAEKVDADGATKVMNSSWNEEGPVASLRRANPKRLKSGFIVLYGDCVVHPDNLRALMAAPDDIAIATDELWQSLWELRFDDIYVDAETFCRDGRRLIEIGNRANSRDDIQGQFTGALKFSAAGWSTVESFVQNLSAEGQRQLDMTAILSLLISRDVVVGVVPVFGKWCEVDSSADLIAYRKALRRRQWSHDWRW